MAGQRKNPRKPAGEVGTTIVSVQGDGTQAATLIPANLPNDKAALELHFAESFVGAFNEGHLSNATKAPDLKIEIVSQLGTEDLDFKILSPLGEYLELAEIAPIGEAFGRHAIKTGHFHVLEMARWVYRTLIKRKGIKYGPDLAGRTVLLLYVANWQFFISDNTVKCLNSLRSTNGCRFSAVYLTQGNGADLTVLYQIWPYDGPPLPSPKAFAELKLMNGEPGKSSWSVDFSNLPPKPAAEVDDLAMGGMTAGCGAKD